VLLEGLPKTQETIDNMQNICLSKDTMLQRLGMRCNDPAKALQDMIQFGWIDPPSTFLSLLGKEAVQW
jgi:hypothetical protein